MEPTTRETRRTETRNALSRGSRPVTLAQYREAVTGILRTHSHVAAFSCEEGSADNGSAWVHTVVEWSTPFPGNARIMDGDVHRRALKAARAAT